MNLTLYRYELSIKTKITDLLGIKYPIIGAPMFLVSNPELVASVSNNGGMGTFASMSYRTIKDLETAIDQIREKTSQPFGMNIVLHKEHNPLWQEQFKTCIDKKIPLVITSMGTPRTLIKEAHANGIKVFCDVVHLKQAKFLEKTGADAIIAVCQGAGGHAGKLSPFAFIPQLADNLEIPVIAAGAISNGRQMAAAFNLGAEAVYVGTRFIATPEANATSDYKQTLIDSGPEDIIYTDEISGVSANWLRVSYDLWKSYKNDPDHFKKLRNWIDFWSAGHGIAQINQINTVSEVIQNMVTEYNEVKNKLP
jgi:nitronate monooxygenase